MANKNRIKLHSYHEKNFMEVVDQENNRSLYFQNSVVQSRISLQTPHTLLLKYTKYMMAASLLAHPMPSRILLVGVGAGSLLHFFNHYLPQCHVDGVDYSEHVLKIARNFFNLPENSRIHIHCDDGLRFITTRQDKDRYDLILLDAFNDEGMAKNIYSNEFFRAASKQLSPHGVICCNLWSGNTDQFDFVKKAIQKNSVGNLFIPVRKRENIIALLFQDAIPWKSICPKTAQLDKLCEKYDIDFQQVSSTAQKHNMKLGEKVQLWLSS